MRHLDIPTPDTLELSIFGAGIGEALAVHVGDGEWLLVDSCLDANGQASGATYLSQLGVPPTAVTMIVVTHWHQDHVEGVEQLITKYQQARIFMPGAFKSQDLLLLVRAGAENEALGTGNLKTSVSFARAVEQLIANRRSPTLVEIDKVLRAKQLGNVGKVMVSALSPSDAARLLSMGQFADFVATGLPSRRRPTKFDPNHCAIALWIQWGDQRILLGSDLVDTGNPNVGWKAALTSQVLTADSARAEVIKVAHHGSENGHSKTFWNKYVSSPVVGMTTYATGRSPPPQPSDIARLIECCREVWCAPVPQPPKPLRAKAVSKFVQSQGIKITRRVKRHGHLRIRLSPSGSISASCNGDAAQL